ncbi:uncharacterized protein LOC110007981 [Amborella trichopoda]|uniref:uncharacterized protein LOC110007981 n=1 Tax=Amborella trichopoda TaxID=13333 RepID=UPI0009C05837|nr:uncharacterized protein LOC110007981 [Amborella trichopoda]|eukprot:XP_020528265.1 uncharacterized protein LOC110007981 [Amborella trichopoda]
MLEGDTEHWWASVKQSWEESGMEANWGKFLGAFNEKYFTDSVRERKEVEFIELQRGNITIEQYAVKFAELSRYAPHIIKTEAQQASKFVRSLRSDIRGRVISANLKTFSPLVDLAMKIERDCEESRVRGKCRMGPAQFGSFKRKAQPPPRRNFGRRDNPRGKKIRRTLSGDIRENRRPTCPYCGKDNHSVADCRKKAGACFGCGKSSHQIRDCLTRGSENQPKPQGQVFALIEWEAKASTSVILGCVLPIHLILLDIQDFDVILGMDWLSTPHAIVDCRDKIVTLRRPNQPELNFFGVKDVSPLHFISAIRASRLLAKTCVGYLAYVVKNRDDRSKLEEIPVVREYPEVFLKELTFLSPVREIGFSIDVVPRPAPHL